ncbi:nucleolar protein 16 [Amborella trichopoda]|uniref:Nucleolar protein 16 n=1 Tax=Amborella trichopoda TaxID=13333 RepID=W1P5K7_AMBTC|nr:nucleolar protein 16 [Amborella trichopoda]ERN02235.1 hypothetical protein AMTR_s00045p00223550 [Amborella trichopoda]|eukprot:XP_006840560.1 nucleolar protein 16 [Amborella trichopoda]
MAGSRRSYRKSRPKVRVGLPKRHPNVFKPSFSIPPKLRTFSRGDWDEKGTVLENYRSFGVVSNPNLLGAQARTTHIIESDALQVPPPKKEYYQNNDGISPPNDPEFEPIDSGSDLEEDDLKEALRKKRRDGKVAPPQPLTRIQRVYISRLIAKYGDDYEKMFMDIKLNAMQHTVAELKKLCKRYYIPNMKAKENCSIVAHSEGA